MIVRVRVLANLFLDAFGKRNGLRAPLGEGIGWVRVRVRVRARI